MSLAAAETALDLRHVTAGYGRTTVLRDVDLAVPRGSVTALLGPNGAGKTTLLKAAAGLVPLASGRVTVYGQDVTGMRPFRRVREGLCLVPEGRGIFPSLSVRENLWLQRPRGTRDAGIGPALEAFPVLGERLGQPAGRLSGGQQQMLALSRCFLSAPKIVLLDEVSMGLAPRVIDEIFEALNRLKEHGVALLLVEQYVHRALQLADRLVLLGRGRVTFSGSPANVDADELMRRYLGAAPMRNHNQRGMIVWRQR